MGATQTREFQDANVRMNGSLTYLGTITATTTKNNHDTAVPFNNTGTGLAGKLLLIQPDATCYVLNGTANTATVTTSNGLKLAADSVFIIWMAPDAGWLAVVSASGTANVKVWELK